MLDSYYKRTHILTSFWGFDSPAHVAPNVHLTGPFFNGDSSQEELVKRLHEKDPDLGAWINEVDIEKEAVLFVTLGSEVIWQEWYMDRMYKGWEILKTRGLNVKVIWALRSDDVKLPEGYDPKFHWVSKWLPQAELLAHPAVKIGLTHCGFGGCTEFIMGGVVTITFPHFGDQSGNARSLVEAGAGVALVPHEMGERMPPADIRRHAEPIFEAKDFADCVTKIMGDPSYS